MVCGSRGVVGPIDSVDSDPSPTIEQGGETKVNVVDTTTNGLLCQILRELRVLNLHQSIITDTNYRIDDVNE